MTLRPSKEKVLDSFHSKQCNSRPVPVSQTLHLVALPPCRTAVRRETRTIGRSLGGQGYLAGSSAEWGEMGLSLTACVRLVILASRMKARSASIVKMIACAAAIQNPGFAPVSQTVRRCASYGHTRVKKIRRPML